MVLYHESVWICQEERKGVDHDKRRNPEWWSNFQSEWILP